MATKTWTVDEFESIRVKRLLAAGMTGEKILACTLPEHVVAVRIVLALELAERTCAACRPACVCKPLDGGGRCPREQECYENWAILHGAGA